MTQKNKPKRTKIFFPHGLQVRFAALVAGSLGVLLIFAGFHGVFIATQGLPTEALEKFEPQLLSSTLRLFLVGFLYISVVTIASIFLSHRTVGPAERLREEILEIARSKKSPEKITIREGDELDDLVKAVNLLIDRMKKKSEK